MRLSMIDATPVYDGDNAVTSKGIGSTHRCRCYLSGLMTARYIGQATTITLITADLAARRRTGRWRHEV